MSLGPISPAGAMPLVPDTGAAAPSGASAPSSGPFSSLVDRFLGGAVNSNNQAESAVRDLALGQTDSLHEVMLQVAQADLAFRLVLEIRNRLTEAYQEIMKMQI